MMPQQGGCVSYCWCNKIIRRRNTGRVGRRDKTALQVVLMLLLFRCRACRHVCLCVYADMCVLFHGNMVGGPMQAFRGSREKKAITG